MTKDHCNIEYMLSRNFRTPNLFVKNSKLLLLEYNIINKKLMMN